MKKSSKGFFIFFLMMFFEAQSIKPAQQSKRQQLVDAIINADLDKIHRLIRRPFLAWSWPLDFINEQDEHGNTPLSIACRYFYKIENYTTYTRFKDTNYNIPKFIMNRFKIIEYLLKHNGQDSLLIRNNRGETPLLIAAELPQGLSHTLDHNNKQTLFYRRRTDDLVSLLLSCPKGIESINIPDSDGATPLYWATARSDKKLVNLLIQNGASLAGKVGPLLINDAYQNLDLPKIKKLIAKGANPHLLCWIHNNNTFPDNIACTSFLSELLSRKRDLENKIRTIESQKTTYERIIDYDDQRRIEFFLIYRRCNDHHFPDYYDAIKQLKILRESRKELDVIDPLFAFIWDLRNTRDEFNNTALHYASQYNKQDLIREFLSNSQA